MWAPDHFLSLQLRTWPSTELPPDSAAPCTQTVALPPRWPGISSLRTSNGISTRESGARPGDYRTSHPPTYIFGRSRRRPAGMATAGSAASRRDPGRPCPFSIEHILSSLPDRRPAARPLQPVGGRNPAEPDEPEAPAAAAPCACCCCCGPRAAPRGAPEPASGPGECARRGEAGPGISLGGRRRGELGSHPNPHPLPVAPSPRPAPQACG